MLGWFGTARANKENILYAIITVVLLERVRTEVNALAGETGAGSRTPRVGMGAVS